MNSNETKIDTSKPVLCDYKTGEMIRNATAEESEASRNAGAEGVITVDGRSCYVQD